MGLTAHAKIVWSHCQTNSMVNRLVLADGDNNLNVFSQRIHIAHHISLSHDNSYSFDHFDFIISYLNRRREDNGYHRKQWEHYAHVWAWAFIATHTHICRRVELAQTSCCSVSVQRSFNKNKIPVAWVPSNRCEWEKFVWERESRATHRYDDVESHN